MTSIGYYIMFALLGAGAAYGLSHKGEPRPGLSPAKKKFVMFLAGVFLVCLMLMLGVAWISNSSLYPG
jgi:hypothetical protein